jgi:cytochrome c biogenesis protein CcdA
LRRAITIGQPQADPPLLAHLFSYDCKYCRTLIDHELSRWSRQRGVPLTVHYYDLGLPGTYDLLVAAGADFGRQDAQVPTVFMGRSVFGGAGEIRTGVPAELERFTQDPVRFQDGAIIPFSESRDTKAIRNQKFEALNLPVIVAAGLLDGINPCAFTTIIFLLSYLTVAGRSRRQILLTGGIFTLAVFLTYLAIGALFYQLAHTLLGHPRVAMTINVMLLAGLVVLAGLSAVDTVRCFRGQATDITLKLPAFLQKRIRTRIRAFARNDVAVGTASFSLGVVIASMELACTGQVYIPIVTMIAEPRYRAAATFNLVVYNLAFILPLVAVFLLVAFGMTSQRLVGFARRHLTTAKLGLTLLFVTLALVTLHNLGWLA